MYKIIGGDKKEYGPVTAEEIKRWIAEGRVNAHTQVQAEGSAEWKTLSTFPEFAEALAGERTTVLQPPTPIPLGPTMAEELVVPDYDLDIGHCIGRAWELMKTNFGPIFGGVAIYLLIVFGISGFGQIPFVGMLFSLASLVVTGPLMGGVYLFLLKNIRRQPATVGDVFSGFQLAFLQLMLGYLVSTLLAGISAGPGAGLATFAIIMMVSQHQASALYIALALLGLIAALIPLAYLSVCWMFSIPLVIDKRMKFWPAMGTSRKAVNRHWWTVFAFLIVVGLINLVGFVVCCVGIFFSVPLTLTAVMYAYEDIFSASAPQAA